MENTEKNSPENTNHAHLPEPSFWPIILAFGLLLIAAGVIFSLIISALGLVVMLAAIVGWTLENRPKLAQELARETEESSHD